MFVYTESMLLMHAVTDAFSRLVANGRNVET